MSLKSIRPSNLVLLAAAPFIIYLFFSSSKYTRSLKAIVGVEEGAFGLLIGFLLIVALSGFGLLSTRSYFTGGLSGWMGRIAPFASVLIPIILILLYILPDLTLPFVYSVVAHSVDPYTSSWIVPTVRPRQLVPEIKDVVVGYFRTGVLIYGLVYVIQFAGLRLFKPRIASQLVRIFEVASILVLFHCLFLAHWGFGSGVAVTLRATVFAYILAAVLGIIWTGLQSLNTGRYTYRVYGGVGLVCLILAGYFGLQPKVDYMLVGSTDARIAIIKGTPQSMSDMIRFGEYDGAPPNDVQIRSAPDVETALELVRESKQVSGAFIPALDYANDLQVITEVSFLPDRYKTPSILFLAVGGLLLILTFGAWKHELHPLAVASEFFVDTIRGIPMLVIILYVGLPLSGAVKDVTGGGIDLSNMARGIFAIAIGYSAYMAEIFRAGIESIPKGQIEAGASLGLSRWKTARLIILPQALRVVIPPLGNEFIAMVKDTSLLSILSVRDVTQRMREFQAASFLPFAPFNTAAILYVVITLACASMLKWIERRYEQKRK